MNRNRPFPPEHGFVPITSPEFGLTCFREDCRKCRSELAWTKRLLLGALLLCAVLAWSCFRSSLVH